MLFKIQLTTIKYTLISINYDFSLSFPFRSKSLVTGCEKAAGTTLIKIRHFFEPAATQHAANESMESSLFPSLPAVYRISIGWKVEHTSPSRRFLHGERGLMGLDRGLIIWLEILIGFLLGKGWVARIMKTWFLVSLENSVFS